MSLHRIHIFISHSWTYSVHYATISSWLSNKSWRCGQASLQFLDYSVPKDDPIHNARTDAALRNAIYDKIGRCHVIVIPTGMYASHSKWIKKEIEGAKHYSKPVLAVNPWGQQRTSSVVSANADKLVGWNSKSVVDGVWDLYYNRRQI